MTVFTSVKDFYDKTREPQLESLIKELEEKCGNVSESEKDAWRTSVPDFASLLYEPRNYINATISRMREQQNWLKQVQILMEQKISDEDKLVADTLFSYKMLQSIKLDAQEYKDLLKDFKIREGDLRDFLERIDEYKIDGDICVEVEHKVDHKNEKSNKRADLVLKRDDKCIIVELKQWTEAQIYTEDGSIKISPYTDELKHPLIQAEEYVKEYSQDFFDDEENKEKRDSNGILRLAPLVYLHNQYFKGGILFDKSWYEDIWKRYDYKHDGIRMIPMFTRSHCDGLIKTIHNFFSKGYVK